MKLTILICAISLSRYECAPETAFSITKMETDVSMGACGLVAEQTLASMPEMLDADGDGIPEAYAKILCRQ
jgi:hypothetical protein